MVRYHPQLGFRQRHDHVDLFPFGKLDHLAGIKLRLRGRERQGFEAVGKNSSRSIRIGIASDYTDIEVGSTAKRLNDIADKHAADAGDDNGPERS